MATFVQIEPDAFNQVFTNDVVGQRGKDSNARREASVARYHHVRRPVRGIQIKDDTYGTIQVRRSNGLTIPLFDAAADGDTGQGDKNSNFLIQSVTEQRAEKQQVILTFGEPYIFFFGEQPRSINVSGILLNTEDFNWRAEWWENYDQFLRGTQCVRNKARVYLSWDDIVVEGYVISASAIEDSSNRNLVQFNFQMFLTNYQNISSIGAAAVQEWVADNVSLDPSEIDLPGNGGVSTTSLVRQVNMDTGILQGQDSNSLFAFLRGSDTSLTATLQGQVVSLLSLAEKFISGRNIRVPIGFTGAAAFDQEVQLSLASIPGAQDIVNGTGTRTVSLNVSNGGLVKEFTSTLDSKFGPVNTGPLSSNLDEFVARTPIDPTGSDKFNNLFDGQLAQDDAAMQKVQDTFAAYGISTDPPSSILSLMKGRIFGIVPIQEAFNTVAGSQSGMHLLSILGVQG